MLFFYAKKENIYPAYVSKHNSNHEKEVIPSTIPNGEEWHYLALKNYLGSKHHGYFHSLICLNSFAAETNRQSHKNVLKNKDFCNVVIPSKDIKIFKNHIKNHLLLMQILSV